MNYEDITPTGRGFVPPNNIDVERALLGALLVDPSRMVDVSPVVTLPEMFWRTSHQHIYRAIWSLTVDGTEIDWLTVHDRVRLAGMEDACGGEAALRSYLVEISNGLPSGYGAERWAGIVRDKWLLREVITRAGRLRDLALDDASTAKDAVDRFVSDAMELSLERGGKDPRSLKEIGDVVRERAAAGGITGLESPWSGLNAITRGFKPGELVIVGSRPGRGKSSFAAAMALHHCRNGVLIYSLEMPGEEIHPRMIAMHAGVDADAYSNGRLDERDRYAAREAEIVIENGSVWVDDAAKLTIQDIHAQARRWAVKHPLSLVIVDYIGLVDATDKRAQRYEQVGEVTRGLKQLARDLGVPVIAPHQLGREAESREPTLADLRESGNCEQDADQVIFIHREEKSDNGVTPVKVIVAKHRAGPTGFVRMNFRRAQTRFEEIVNR